MFYESDVGVHTFKVLTQMSIKCCGKLVLEAAKPIAIT